MIRSAPRWQNGPRALASANTRLRNRAPLQGSDAVLAAWSSTPCWRATGTGFRYADREGTPDAVTAMRATAGAAGQARITLTAKGRTIPFPPGSTLPFSPPVRVQLQNGESCWEATFSTPLQSDAEHFQARSD